MIITNLWIAIAAMLAIALVIIWLPYFRNTKHQTNQVNSRSLANTDSYKQSLSNLEQQHQQQRISDDEFSTLKTELARKLIQDEASQEKQLNVGKRTIAWPVLASGLTVSLSLFMYLELGASDQLLAASQPNEQQAHGALSQDQQMEVMLQKMEREVEQNPQDTQLLFQLAHTYISVGAFDQAISSFKKLAEVEGEHAEFLGPLAQAMYYKNSQVMTPDIQQVIDKALALDPENSSTLVLLGMDNFVNSNYAQAITYWQKVLNSKRPGVDVAALESAVEEAKSRIALTGEAIPQTPAPVAATAGLRVKVSISDTLQGQYQDDQILFVYAIPATGPRMPLAAMKLRAKDLPKEVVLDDSMSMGGAKLSDHQFVQLFAVLSQTGTAGIKPGDLRGLLESADTTSEHPYPLVIDTVVE